MKLTLELIEDLRAYDGLPSKAEYQALLDSARALARLEEWLGPGDVLDRHLEFMREDGGPIAVGLAHRDGVRFGGGSDLASAIHAALDEAEARK